MEQGGGGERRRRGARGRLPAAALARNLQGNWASVQQRPKARAAGGGAGADLAHAAVSYTAFKLISNRYDSLQQELTTKNQSSRVALEVAVNFILFFIGSNGLKSQPTPGSLAFWVLTSGLKSKCIERHHFDAPNFNLNRMIVRRKRKFSLRDESWQKAKMPNASARCSAHVVMDIDHALNHDLDRCSRSILISILLYMPVRIRF
ncbi:hypothetical protein EVAR_84671_1 [Eumeta japonica]|uniref:Uncharacterized protein n=1 Tax=Eumeta variegata TaxID=151549 RepID=A0A4C1UZA3_EUMVA|nr:hypothetical protein EVAR_84671_1 [Eumeta japonica]